MIVLHCLGRHGATQLAAAPDGKESGWRDLHGHPMDSTGHLVQGAEACLGCCRIALGEMT